MSALFSSALAAAHDAAASQHYPHGTLYVVATPIGNLADISLRSLHVLQLADAVACEDTRHTQQMLRAYGIEKSGPQLMAVHQHNEAEAAHAVLARLQSGERLAYVSDAGTPGVSDPGARLVATLQAAGVRCVPLPGASSVTALLSVAGVASSGGHAGFEFVGFLPGKAQERSLAVEALRTVRHPVVVLEAPHRIEATANALSVLGPRKLTVGRELTKQFEQIATMAAQDLPPWLQEDPHRLRGEFALVLHGSDVENNSGQGERVLRLLLAELPLKTAVRLAADITGSPRNALYELGLRLKADRSA